MLILLCYLRWEFLKLKFVLALLDILYCQSRIAGGPIILLFMGSMIMSPRLALGTIWPNYIHLLCARSKIILSNPWVARFVVIAIC